MVVFVLRFAAFAGAVYLALWWMLSQPDILRPW
jgi:hypothetical protein